MTYKITVKVQADNLNSADLKQAARQFSEVLTKMGMEDHAIECKLGKLGLFGIRRDLLGLEKAAKKAEPSLTHS